MEISNINLRDWYSQSQLQSLLNMPYRMQVKRFLENEGSFIFRIEICGRPYYLRQDVNKYLQDLVRKGSLNPFDVEKRKIKQIAYNISTKEWLPRCLAIKLFEQDSRRLYDKSAKHIYQLVRTKKAYGQLWFNREDIIDFLTNGLSIEEVVEKRKGIEQEVERFNISLPERFFDIDI